MKVEVNDWYLIYIDKNNTAIWNYDVYNSHLKNGNKFKIIKKTILI